MGENTLKREESQLKAHDEDPRSVRLSQEALGWRKVEAAAKQKEENEPTEEEREMEEEEETAWDDEFGAQIPLDDEYARKVLERRMQEREKERKEQARTRSRKAELRKQQQEQVAR